MPQWEPGQSGNPAGRPPKKKSTFDDEIQAVFGAQREITIKRYNKAEKYASGDLGANGTWCCTGRS